MIGDIKNFTVDMVDQHLAALRRMDEKKNRINYIQANIIDNNTWWFFIEKGENAKRLKLKETSQINCLIEDIAKTIQGTEGSLLIAVMSRYKKLDMPERYKATALVNYLLENINSEILLPDLNTLKTVLLLLKHNSFEPHTYARQVLAQDIKTRILSLTESISLPRDILFFRGVLPVEYHESNQFQVNEAGFDGELISRDNAWLQSIVEGNDIIKHSALLSHLKSQAQKDQVDYINTVKNILEDNQINVFRYVTILFNVLEALQDKDYNIESGSEQAFYMQVMQLIAEKFPVMDFFVEHDEIPPYHLESREYFPSIPIVNRRILKLLSSEETAAEWYSWLKTIGLMNREAILHALQLVLNTTTKTVSVQDLQEEGDKKKFFAKNLYMLDFEKHFSSCVESKRITNISQYIGVLQKLLLRQKATVQLFLQSYAMEKLSSLIEQITIDSNLAACISFEVELVSSEKNSSLSDYLIEKINSNENISQKKRFLAHFEGLLKIVSVIYRQSQNSEDYQKFLGKFSEAMAIYKEGSSTWGFDKMRKVYLRYAEEHAPIKQPDEAVFLQTENDKVEGDTVIEELRKNEVLEVATSTSIDNHLNYLETLENDNEKMKYIYSEIYKISSNDQSKESIETIITNCSADMPRGLRLLNYVLYNIEPQILLKNEKLRDIANPWNLLFRANAWLYQYDNVSDNDIQMLERKFWEVMILAAPGFKELDNDFERARLPFVIPPEIQKEYCEKILYARDTQALLELSEQEPSNITESLRNFLRYNKSLIEKNFMPLNTSLSAGLFKKMSLAEYLLIKIYPSKDPSDIYKHQKDVISFLKLILEKNNHHLNESNFLKGLRQIARNIGKSGTMMAFVDLYKEHNQKVQRNQREEVGNSEAVEQPQNLNAFPKIEKKVSYSEMPSGSVMYESKEHQSLTNETPFSTEISEIDNEHYNI